ncbi:hypothetical protein M569_17419 [Genlisea aurea]|uniref:Uncharacterized protein n=1 Tax=Genlisea aurea TaxID=192259 RepID=S8D428_9LAMI|nr:hypothetical protein M569_17419 [Genlisea aurea]
MWAVEDKKSATDLHFFVNAVDGGAMPEGGSQEWGFDMEIGASAATTTQSAYTWRATECRMAICMAQRLEPSCHFYANLRFIHEEVLAHKGESASPATYQGDGYNAYQNILHVAATLEIQRTKAIVEDSVGFCLLMDGSNKGRYSTKGELVLFRDVDAQGELRVRTLGMQFVAKGEIKECTRLKQTPFGHQKQWERLRLLFQERYPLGPPPMALDYLPLSMHGLLQLATDGASVNHRLAATIRDKFVSDLIPGIDDIHQLERCAVHAFRQLPLVKTYLDIVRTAVRVYRKKEMLALHCGASEDFRQLHKIYSGRWMQSLSRALSSFLWNYGILSETIVGLAKSRTSAAWSEVTRHWFDFRFLQTLAGLMDIAAAVQIAEKKLQARDINFVDRDIIVRDLSIALRQPVFEGDWRAACEHYKLLTKELRREGNVFVFRGHKVIPSSTRCNLGSAGSMDIGLKTIRDHFIKEMDLRFQNRSILSSLDWLNLARHLQWEWPGMAGNGRE